MAKAKMDAGAECEMPVRSSLEIEFLGMLVGGMGRPLLLMGVNGRCGSL